MAETVIPPPPSTPATPTTPSTPAAEGSAAQNPTQGASKPASIRGTAEFKAELVTQDQLKLQMEPSARITSLLTPEQWQKVHQTALAEAKPSPQWVRVSDDLSISVCTIGSCCAALLLIGLVIGFFAWWLSRRGASLLAEKAWLEGKLAGIDERWEQNDAILTAMRSSPAVKAARKREKKKKNTTKSGEEAPAEGSKATESNEGPGVAGGTV